MEGRTAEIRTDEIRIPKVRMAEARKGEVGPAEVRTTEVRTEEVGPAEIRTTEISTTEVRVSELRTTEVHIAQVRSGEIGPEQIRTWSDKVAIDELPIDRQARWCASDASRADTREVGPAEVGTLDHRTPEDCVLQISPDERCPPKIRTPEKRCAEDCIGQVRTREIRPREVGDIQVCVAQVRSGQIRMLEVRPRCDAVAVDGGPGTPCGTGLSFHERRSRGCRENDHQGRKKAAHFPWCSRKANELATAPDE